MSRHSHQLFVHFMASAKNTQRFYLDIASFPWVDDPRLLVKTKCLVLNMESMGIIYLDCLRSKKVALTPKRKATIQDGSLAIAKLVRPKDMPASAFKSANIVLPDTQSSRAGSEIIKEFSLIWQRLEDYYKRTRLPYLPNLEFSRLKDQLLLPSDSPGLPTLQRTYRRILEEDDLLYQNLRSRELGYRLAVLCAVIKFCESMDPPLSTLSENDKYTRPSPWRLDWQHIRYLALDLAPESMDSSCFTKDYC